MGIRITRIGTQQRDSSALVVSVPAPPPSMEMRLEEETRKFILNLPIPSDWNARRNSPGLQKAYANRSGNLDLTDVFGELLAPLTLRTRKRMLYLLDEMLTNQPEELQPRHSFLDSYETPFLMAEPANEKEHLHRLFINRFGRWDPCVMWQQSYGKTPAPKGGIQLLLTRDNKTGMGISKAQALLFDDGGARIDAKHQDSAQLLLYVLVVLRDTVSPPE